MTTALIISSVASFRSLFLNRDPRTQRGRYITSSSRQQVLVDKSQRQPKDPYPLTEFLTNISALGTRVSDRDLSSQIDHSLDDGIRVEHEVDIVHENL